MVASSRSIFMLIPAWLVSGLLCGCGGGAVNDTAAPSTAPSTPAPVAAAPAPAPTPTPAPAPPPPPPAGGGTLGTATGIGYAAGSNLQVVQSGSGRTINVTPTSSTVLDSAIAGAQPGDTVVVAGGTYNWTGGSSVYVSGSASNWIVIRAATDASGNPQAVTINGPGIGTLDSSGASHGVICIQTYGNYLDIEGLTCNNFAHGFALITGGHVRLHGNTVTQVGDSGIANYNVPSVGPMASYIEYSNNVVTYTNQLWNNSGLYGWGQGISGWGNYVTIANNRVSNTNGESIGISGQYGWVVGNTVLESCAAGIYLQESSQSLVEKNFVRNDYANNASFYASCLSNGSSGPRFGYGIRIAAEDGQSNTGVAYTFLNQGTVRNNLVVGMLSAIAYNNFKIGSPMSSWRIENNTLVGGTTGSQDLLEMDAPLSGAHTDVIFANNLFDWTSGSNASATRVVQAGGVSYNHSLWFGASAGGAAGSGDVSGDPKLLNANSATPSDYTPQAGSAASGAASATYAPADDFFGNPRSAKSTVDIGAIIAR